jgi:hypothetical protein
VCMNSCLDKTQAKPETSPRTALVPAIEPGRISWGKVPSVRIFSWLPDEEF